MNAYGREAYYTLGEIAMHPLFDLTLYETRLRRVTEHFLLDAMAAMVSERLDYINPTFDTTSVISPLPTHFFRTRNVPIFLAFTMCRKYYLMQKIV